MSFDQKSEELENKIKACATQVEQILAQVNKRIVGQSQVGNRLVMALIAQGHVLLEGLPGLAKTTSIKTLAEATDLHFKRIQFTPDLLPADVIGTQIFDPQVHDFKVKKGPIFTHLLLADEINRAPAKVQSALLEAMEERQVTIGDQSWPLEEPFLVLATQNPIEQEGTYPLPEAQVDRFLFKVLVKYGTQQDEQEIIRRAELKEQIKIEKVTNKYDLRQMSEVARSIYVSDKIRRYITDIVFATRNPQDFGLKDLVPLIETGASPRASLALDRVAKINALFEGRGFVTPQDIKDISLDILRHRIRATYEAEAENITTDQIIERILQRIDVP